MIVIHLKPLRTLFQRNESGRRQDTRLAHASPQHLPNAAASFDELAAANDHRAYRRAESLAQTELNGIEFFRHIRDVFANISCSIQDSRAVQVNGDSGVVRPVAYLFRELRRINGTT